MGRKDFEADLDEYSFDCYQRECAEEKYDEYLSGLSEEELEAELLKEVRMNMKRSNGKRNKATTRKC